MEKFYLKPEYDWIRILQTFDVASTSFWSMSIAWSNIIYALNDLLQKKGEFQKNWILNFNQKSSLYKN